MNCNHLIWLHLSKRDDDNFVGQRLRPHGLYLAFSASAQVGDMSALTSGKAGRRLATCGRLVCCCLGDILRLALGSKPKTDEGLDDGTAGQ